MQKTNADARIDAYAIALDETDGYIIADKDRPYIRAIRGVYCFDRNRRTYCCELTPSYFLIHLYDAVIWTEAGEALDGFKLDELDQKYAYCGGEDCYMHCSRVQRIIDRDQPHTVGHIGDVDWADPDMDYDERIEALVEGLSADCPF